jgi:hypothetical protein
MHKEQNYKIGKFKKILLILNPVFRKEKKYNLFLKKKANISRAPSYQGRREKKIVDHFILNKQ